MEICNNYKDSKTFVETNVNYEVVRSWWHSFGIVLGHDLEELNHWLSFWHFKIE
jgi:hypothetical protein